MGRLICLIVEVDTEKRHEYKSHACLKVIQELSQIMTARETTLKLKGKKNAVHVLGAQ